MKAYDMPTVRARALETAHHIITFYRGCAIEQSLIDTATRRYEKIVRWCNKKEGK